MTLLDERGRVAGRFNVVDVAAVIVFLVLMPFAVALYLLFRTPTPTLVNIVPKTLLQGPNQRLEIDGTNFRPFMRVTFNTIPANSFLLGSTKYAIVDVPDLKPGVYDVVLYDYMQEIARLPKALTVSAASTDVELEVTGTFKSAPDGFAAQLKVGDTFPAVAPHVAEVVAVGPLVPGELGVRVGDGTVVVPLRQQDLSATLRIRCSSIRMTEGAARCLFPGPDQPVVVAPAVMLTLPTNAGPVLFQIGTARAQDGCARESMSPMNRLAACWALAGRACASLFEPRTEVNVADREVEALLRASWIGSTSESFVAKLHAAWLDSRCRSLLRAAVNGRS